MTKQILTGQNICLYPKSIADARLDYRWQKDAELMALSGNAPLRESFLEYLTRNVSAYDAAAGMESFAIRTQPENRHIGNCALYNIDYAAGEAQLGIAIGERDCWGKGYGLDTVMVLINYAFDQLGLVKLCLKTFENNNRARRCFEKCGFTPCGALLQDGDHYVLMELVTSSRPKPSIE